MKIIRLGMVLVVSFLLQMGSADLVWAKPSKEVPSPNVKIEQWVGCSFTFMPMPTAQQADGYEMFTLKEEMQGFAGDRSLRIPYANHVGKEVTVTEIVPFPAGENQQEYMVYMKVHGTGEKLVGRSMRGQLEGLVLTRDVKQARQQFLGKTIYPKFRELAGVSHSDGMTVPKAVPLAIGSSVTVVDVYAGNQLQYPIWLLVAVGGEKAILPIAYSWTNTPVVSWGAAPPWQDIFFIQDPRISLGGSIALWDDIENGNVEEGMTKGQVQLSWGKPSRIKEQGSVWIYGSNILRFHGENLESVETILEEQ